MPEKLQLQMMIHTAAASLRFGGDGYFLTLSGTNKDKDKASALSALNGVPLLITIEPDYEELAKQQPITPEGE